MKSLRVWLMVFLSALALHAAEFTGRWKGAVVSPEGGRREYEFVLKAAGKTVTGLAATPQGDFPITGGEVLEDEIRFDVERSPGRAVRYRATMLGEELHVFVPGNRGGAQEVVTYRASLDPVPAPPPPISLPPLRVVPGNGLARTPPMGWNSWNKFRTRISDKLVREIADGMVSSGMQKAGYTFINIDDGWEGTRDGSGNLRTNARFPDMKALAAYIHSKGLKVGLYSSPGPRTCAGFEGSFNHEVQDARAFAAWGRIQAHLQPLRVDIGGGGAGTGSSEAR